LRNTGKEGAWRGGTLSLNGLLGIKKKNILGLTEIKKKITGACLEVLKATLGGCSMQWNPEKNKGTEGGIAPG